MSASKEQFIDRYGGFLFGESQEQLKQRMARIDAIHAKVKAGQASAHDIEEQAELRGQDDE